MSLAPNVFTRPDVGGMAGSRALVTPSTQKAIADFLPHMNLSLPQDMHVPTTADTIAFATRTNVVEIMRIVNRHIESADGWHFRLFNRSMNTNMIESFSTISTDEVVFEQTAELVAPRHVQFRREYHSYRKSHYQLGLDVNGEYYRTADGVEEFVYKMDVMTQGAILTQKFLCAATVVETQMYWLRHALAYGRRSVNSVAEAEAFNVKRAGCMTIDHNGLSIIYSEIPNITRYSPYKPTYSFAVVPAGMLNRLTVGNKNGLNVSIAGEKAVTRNLETGYGTQVLEHYLSIPVFEDMVSSPVNADGGQLDIFRRRLRIGQYTIIESTDDGPNTYCGEHEPAVQIHTLPLDAMTTVTMRTAIAHCPRWDESGSHFAFTEDFISDWAARAKEWGTGADQARFVDPWVVRVDDSASINYDPNTGRLKNNGLRACFYLGEQDLAYTPHDYYMEIARCVPEKAYKWTKEDDEKLGDLLAITQDLYDPADMTDVPHAYVAELIQSAFQKTAEIRDVKPEKQWGGPALDRAGFERAARQAQKPWMFGDIFSFMSLAKQIGGNRLKDLFPDWHLRDFVDYAGFERVLHKLWRAVKRAHPRLETVRGVVLPPPFRMTGDRDRDAMIATFRGFLEPIRQNVWAQDKPNMGDATLHPVPGGIVAVAGMADAMGVTAVAGQPWFTLAVESGGVGGNAFSGIVSAASAAEAKGLIGEIADGYLKIQKDKPGPATFNAYIAKYAGAINGRTDMDNNAKSRAFTALFNIVANASLKAQRTGGDWRNGGVDFDSERWAESIIRAGAQIRDKTHTADAAVRIAERGRAVPADANSKVFFSTRLVLSPRGYDNDARFSGLAAAQAAAGRRQAAAATALRAAQDAVNATAGLVAAARRDLATAQGAVAGATDRDAAESLVRTRQATVLRLETELAADEAPVHRAQKEATAAADAVSLLNAAADVMLVPADPHRAHAALLPNDYDADNLRDTVGAPYVLGPHARAPKPRDDNWYTAEQKRDMASGTRALGGRLGDKYEPFGAERESRIGGARASELDGAFLAWHEIVPLSDAAYKGAVVERVFMSIRQKAIKERLSGNAIGQFAAFCVLFSEVHRDTFYAMLDHGIRVPFNMILARPFIQIDTAAIMFAVAGAGRLTYCYVDTSFQYDGTHKKWDLNSTMWMGAALPRSEDVLILPDCMFAGYRSGLNLRFFDREHPFEPEKSDSANAEAPAIFAMDTALIDTRDALVQNPASNPLPLFGRLEPEDCPIPFNNSYAVFQPERPAFSSWHAYDSYHKFRRVNADKVRTFDSYAEMRANEWISGHMYQCRTALYNRAINKFECDDHAGVRGLGHLDKEGMEGPIANILDGGITFTNKY